MFTLVIFSLSSNVYAVSEFKMCDDYGILRTFKLIGLLIAIVKILIPVLIIIMGSISFAKAVMAGDDKGIKEAGSNLGKKMAAGIVIFFIPTLLLTILNFVNGFADIYNSTDFQKCNVCSLKGDFDSCDSYIETAKAVQNNKE
jgi:hypothetical protein